MMGAIYSSFFFAFELWLFALFLNVVGVRWSGFISELYAITVEGVCSLRFLLLNIVFVAVFTCECGGRIMILFLKRKASGAGQALALVATAGIDMK